QTGIRRARGPRVPCVLPDISPEGGGRPTRDSASFYLHMPCPAAGSIPDKGDFAESFLVEHFDALGDVATTGTAVEGQRPAIVLERPHHHALQPGGREPFTGGRKQPAAEADTLIFRPEVEFVDFPLLGHTARPVAAERG